MSSGKAVLAQAISEKELMGSIVVMAKHHGWRGFADRFMSKIAFGTGCWDWAAHVDPAGYGRIRDGNGRAGEVLYAHRVVVEAMHGPIPSDREIDHLCRNRRCVRPDHLEVVSHRVNMLRGESPGARVRRTGKCLRGHEINDENVYWRPDGSGYNCRVCRRLTRKPGT